MLLRISKLRSSNKKITSIRRVLLWDKNLVKAITNLCDQIIIFIYGNWNILSS